MFGGPGRFPGPPEPMRGPLYHPDWSNPCGLIRHRQFNDLQINGRQPFFSEPMKEGLVFHGPPPMNDCPPFCAPRLDVQPSFHGSAEWPPTGPYTDDRPPFRGPTMDDRPFMEPRPPFPGPRFPHPLKEEPFPGPRLQHPLKEEPPFPGPCLQHPLKEEPPFPGPHFPQPGPRFQHPLTEAPPFPGPRFLHSLKEEPFLGPRFQHPLKEEPPFINLMPRFDQPRMENSPMHAALRIRNQLMNRPMLPLRNHTQEPQTMKRLIPNTSAVIGGEYEHDATSFSRKEEFNSDDFTGGSNRMDLSNTPSPNKFKKIARGRGRIAMARGTGRGTEMCDHDSMSVLASLGEKLDPAAAAKLGVDYDAVQAALKSFGKKQSMNVYSEEFGGRTQCERGYTGDGFNGHRGGHGRGPSGWGGFGANTFGSKYGAGGNRGGDNEFGAIGCNIRGIRQRGGNVGQGGIMRGVSHGNNIGWGERGSRGGAGSYSGAGDHGRVRGRSGVGRSAGGRSAGTIRAWNSKGVTLSTNATGSAKLSIAPKHVFSKQPDVNYEVLSRDLGVYASYLKNYPMGRDYVVTVESARTTCQTELMMSYVVEDLLKHKDKTVYTGVLSVGGAFLARSVGTAKTDVKHDTYRMAYELLITKNIADIIKLRDPGVAAIKRELLTQFGLSVEVNPACRKAKEEYDSSKHLMSGTVVVNEKTNINIEQQFKVIQDRIKGTPHINQPVCYLDSYILQAQLHPVLLIRCSSKSDSSRIMHADLYVENYLISTGSARTKKDAQIEAYGTAWATIAETPPPDIVNTFMKSDPFLYTGEDLIDINVKGVTKIGMNNLKELFSSKVPVFQDWRPLKDLILIDWHFYAHNRKQNAFHILNMSATASGLFLEWSFDKRVCPLTSRHAAGCYMKLQRQMCGFEVCSSKWFARNEAALNTLRQVYVNQPIIAVDPVSDYSAAIPWTKYLSDCEAWEPAPDEAPPEGAVEFEETKPYLYLMHLLCDSYEKKIFRGVLIQDYPEEFRRDVNRVWYDRGNIIDLTTFENHIYMFLIHNQELRPAYFAMTSASVTSLNNYRLIRSTDINDVY